MVLGDITATRKLMGNPSTTNLPDSEITTALQYGTDAVEQCTMKFDWEADTSHKFYNVAVTAAQYYASSYLLDRFGTTDFTKATTHLERADKLCMDLKKALEELSLTEGGGGSGVGGSGEPKFNIVVAEYKSFSKNKKAPVYRSPNVPFSEGGGGGGSGSGSGGFIEP